MANNKAFTSKPPLTHPDTYEHLRLLAQSIHAIIDGRTNNRGELTLLNGTATTVLVNERIGPKSTITLFPVTANAANLLRTSDVYYSATDNQATFTHGNTANADQDYFYTIVGG